MLAAAEIDADPATDTDGDVDGDATREETPAASNAVEIAPLVDDAVPAVDEAPAQDLPAEAAALQVVPIEAPAEALVEAPEEALVEPAEAPAVGRPRRRRAASRPAGPPLS